MADLDKKKLETVLKLIVEHCNDHPSLTSLTSLMSVEKCCSVASDVENCLKSWTDTWSKKNLELEDEIAETSKSGWEEEDTELTSSFVDKWWKFVNDDLPSEYGSDDEGPSEYASGDEWYPQPDDDEEMTSDEDEEGIENDQSSRNHLPPTRVKLDNVLIIPLQNVYPTLNQLSFTTLSRQDLFVSELFRSINFLDVHLAIIARYAYSEEENLENEHLFWIDEWINSDNSIPLTTPFQIDLTSQLVGEKCELFDRKFIDCDRINGNEYDYPVYYYPVIIIQPRHQSIYLGCRYNFEDVLNQLCSLAQLTGETKDQSLVISILGQILSFCREKPFCIWKDPTVDCETRGSVRARRLMELCNKLNAKKEGLELLDILRTADLNLDIHNESTNFRLSSSAEKKTFCCHVQLRLYCGAGVLNIEIVNAVADFVSQVGGWDDCSNLILDWIQLSHLNRQFVIFSSLAIRLFENGCVEGTLKIVKRLSSLFSHEDFTLPQYRLDWFQIDSLNFYVKMIIFLEENPETPDPDRLSQLLAFFRRLKTREQCILVICMNKVEILTGSLRHEICRRFCEIICSTGLRDIDHLCRSCLSQIFSYKLPLIKIQNFQEIYHLYPHSSLVKSLINSFVELRDDQLLISFLEMIFTKSSKDIQAEANWAWTESTIASRISSSPSMKNLFYDLFDSKMDLLKEQMDASGAVECLPFASLMEKREHFKDLARVASFTALIPLMPMVELAQLFIAISFPHVWDKVWFGGKVCLDSLINDEMLSRDVKTLSSLKVLSISTLKKILYRFIQSENSVHVRTLILVIAQHEEGSDRDWDCLAENLTTIDLIFTSADYLVDYNSLLCSEEMRDVFIASVDSIIQGFSLLLDRLEPDGLEEPVTSRDFQRFVNSLSFIFPVFNIANYLWPNSRLQVEKMVEQFAGLIIKMPFKLHSLVILSVFEGSFDSYSWHDCDPLFTDLCRQFVTHRFYEKFSSMFHSQILFECFLTFDDYVSLPITCRKLCSEKDNFFVEKIIISRELQKLASHSAQRRAAFCSLLDHQIENLNQCSEQDLSEELSQLQIIRQRFVEK